MTILRSKTVWRHERPANETRRSSDLTPEEQEHVKKALRTLLIRFRSIAGLAEALKSCKRTVAWSYSKKGKPSAGTAVRVARAARVPVDDVLSGKFPKPGTCPMCGRG